MFVLRLVILNEKDAVNIMLLILEAANDHAEGDTKKMGATTKTTDILYRALFDHPLLKEYWKALTQQGLLSFDLNSQTFKTTAEGRNFIRVYKEMDYDVIKARTRTSSLSPRRKNNYNMLLG